MAVEIQSKKGIVSKAPHELYMLFVDMRNFVNFLPEEKKQGVTADYDSIHAEVQGFNIGVKVVERVPYSRVVFQDDGAPFTFEVAMFFNPIFLVVINGNPSAMSCTNVAPWPMPMSGVPVRFWRTSVQFL